MLWWQVRRVDDVPRRAQRATLVLLALVAVQIGLGIATLLLVVPLHLAATHQAGAVLVFAAALNAAHALR
jgi:cytochrome c oxidase assembly protein subunit 15